MTKAKNKPAKVRGAVLIMILAVMTVLIILLAGSIAVVYSTHERVAKKYQESQAYYTMRSTLKACMDSIIQDTGNALSTQDVYYYEGGTDPIKKLSGSVSTDKLQRGRYEELILYKVPVSTDTNSASDNYNKWYDEKTKPTAENKITSSSEVNITVADINGAGITSATYFSQYKSQYAVPERTSSMKKGVDDTIIFTVDVSSIDNMGVDESGNRLTKMLDTDDKAIVKLQILERRYNLGGGSTIGEQFVKGDRTKDYFRIKATCEITIDDELQTYTVYYSTKEPEPQTTGVSSLSRITPGSKIRMINQANSLEDTTYSFSNDSYTSGDVSIFGDLEITASGCYFVLEDKDIMLIKGKLDTKDQPPPIRIAQAGGTVYCKDLITKYGIIQSGSASGGNIICSGTYETENKDTAQNVNLYADEFKFTNGNPPSTVLFTGTNCFNTVRIMSSPSNYVTVSGNVITYNDNFRKLLGTSTISKSLIFEYDDWSTSPPTHKVDTYDFTLGSYSLVSDTVGVNPVSINTSNVVKVDYETDATYDTASYKKKITVPVNLAGYGSKDLEVKTRRAIFDERFEETGTDSTDTWDSKGNFDIAAGATADETKEFLWKHLKDRDSLPTATSAGPAGSGVTGVSGGSITVQNDPTDSTKGTTTLNFDSIIKNSTGVLKLQGAYKGNICFDTTDGDVTVVFSNTITGNFYVNGSNKLKIYLTSDGSAGSRLFHLGSSGDMFSLIDFNTINASNGNINQVSDEPYGPKTTIYVPDDSTDNPTVDKITCYQLTKTCLLNFGTICAQIDAPKTDFAFNSSGGKKHNVQLKKSGFVFPEVSYAILGSTFTNSLAFAEDRGIWAMNTPNPPGNKTVNLVERYR